ncbi:MAG: hypothetical protein NC223_01985 [Butyrivibrio sp.]|nr:hypothetical protein [Butyrivibrio sp.]
MKLITKKTAFLGLTLCMAVQIAGCASSGTGNGGSDESKGTAAEQTEISTTESVTEQTTANAAEAAALNEKETKPEEPGIMSVTAWSRPDLSDFREIFYPGFELETEVIDGKSYRKFVADNGWYVIDKGKKSGEDDCIIEIGRAGQSGEYPICDTIGGVIFDVLRRDAYSVYGNKTSIAPRLFWSDVTGDGQEDICIRLDSIIWENGNSIFCCLYVYDCANDNFITIAGDSFCEALKNEITVSDAEITADGNISLSVTESEEKRDFTVEVEFGITDRALGGCSLSPYKQYIVVRDGKISVGNWINVFIEPRSNDVASGVSLDGPLVYKTLEFNAETDCFDFTGETQMELVDTYRYADTVDFKSEYWENYIKEHKEQ